MDMGKERHYLTSTVETFLKQINGGSSFYFIDIDYGKGGTNGVKGPQLAYFENCTWDQILEKPIRNSR